MYFDACEVIIYIKFFSSGNPVDNKKQGYVTYKVFYKLYISYIIF